MCDIEERLKRLQPVAEISRSLREQRTAQDCVNEMCYPQTIGGRLYATVVLTRADLELIIDMLAKEENRCRARYALDRDLNIVNCVIRDRAEHCNSLIVELTERMEVF